MTVTYLCFPFVPCRNNTDRISLLIRRKSSSDVFCSEAFFNMCATVDMQTLKILRKKIQRHAAHCDVIREMTSPPWPCVCSCPVFVRACVTDSAVSLAEARCLHVMNIHNKSQNLSINVSTNRGSWASGPDNDARTIILTMDLASHRQFIWSALNARSLHSRRS